MKGWQLVVMLSGCVVNGKAYRPGSSSSSSTPPASPAASSPASAASGTQPVGAPAAEGDRSDLYTPDGRVREDARYYKEPPYLSAPADPWAAVQGEQPLRWTEEAANHWTLRGNEITCDAAHDHCLVKDAWFFVKPSDLDRHAQYKASKVTAAIAVFGPTRPAQPWNARPQVNGENLIAYRTVPATKKNLVPGALVIGLGREHILPRTAISAYEASWYFGELESVDYDLGVYQLKDFDDTLPLEGARVAVLEWRENTKVKIVGGKKREELAVKANEVFLPK
jgi:hypothetical protein